MGLTKIWRIKEAPQFEVEQTPGAWVLWGPCCRDEDCVLCGGTNSRVLDSCGFVPGSTSPSNQDMIRGVTGLERWTPERIQ